MKNENSVSRSGVEKIMHLVENLHIKLIIILFSALLVIITVAVIARNYGIPIMWTDELSKILFVWLTFLAAALAVFQGGHLALDLFRKFIERYRILVIGINIFSIAILAALIRPTLQVIKLGATSFTSMLRIPWSYLYLPFLFFILLSILYHIFGIIQSLKMRKN